MQLEFTKMHGAGNDFVCVSLFDQTVDNPPQLARAITDRHLGVGGDGLMLIGPPDRDTPHINMELYNADGSRAEMCGNGIRCAAKLAYDRGWARCNPIRIETDAGVFDVRVMLESPFNVYAATVDLDPPILDPRRIPVSIPGDQVVETAISLGDRDVAATCMSIGVPHAVVFVESLDAVAVAVLGPRIEKHASFPRGANVDFAECVSRERIRVATWERGCGATQSCGTGSCAAVVAGVLTGRTGRAVAVETPGGDLDVRWDESTGRLTLTGPVAEAFRGVWNLRTA